MAAHLTKENGYRQRKITTGLLSRFGGLKELSVNKGKTTVLGCRIIGIS